VRSTDEKLPVVYDSSLSVNYIELRSREVYKMWCESDSEDL